VGPHGRAAHDSLPAWEAFEEITLVPASTFHLPWLGRHYRIAVNPNHCAFPLHNSRLTAALGGFFNVFEIIKAKGAGSKQPVFDPADYFVRTASRYRI
jgi:hypothetical protein